MHMINCIIVNRKFRSNTEDVCVHRTAADAIGTDRALPPARKTQIPFEQ